MSDTTLDLESLLQEFNLPDVSKPSNVPTNVSGSIPKEEVEGSVENITRQNMARANRLLDGIEQSIASGGDNSWKVMEAAAKLIDSITTASEVLTSIELTEKTLNFKERSLDMRKYEFETKMQAKLDRPDTPESLTQNNTFFVGSREDVMKIWKESGMSNNKITTQKLMDYEPDSSEE